MSLGRMLFIGPAISLQWMLTVSAAIELGSRTPLTEFATVCKWAGVLILIVSLAWPCFVPVESAKQEER